jgi:hypothetical protein
MPVKSVQEALQRIDSFKGRATEFTLEFPDVLNDPVGANIAIIGDRILSRGWLPDGYSQMPGFRIYRYKSMD